MKNNHNVITFFNKIYKVITFFRRNYNVYTLHNSNYSVITFFKKIYNVITKTYTYYIVITFSLPAYALSFDAPLTDGQLAFGQLDPNEKLFIQESYLNIGKKSNNLFQVPSDNQGRFIIGIPQDTPQIELILQKGTISKKTIFPVSPRSWDEEYISGLPQTKVQPDLKNQERITQEALQMRQARQTSTYPNFPKNWQNPVPDYKRISSRFGSRRILNNIKKQGHSGTDLAAPIGTPVVAPCDGKVVFIHPDMFLTGQTILIDHGYGVFSSYSHLNSINVKLNQVVKSGDMLGMVGQTGRATGPPLHFTITWYGVRVNPVDLIQLTSLEK